MAYGTRPYVTLHRLEVWLARAGVRILRWFGRRIGPFFFLKEALVVTALSAVYRLMPAFVLALIGLVMFQLLFGFCLLQARKRLGGSSWALETDDPGRLHGGLPDGRVLWS